MKRILNTLTILILCVTLIYPLNTYAKLNTIKSDEDYVIPSDYAFTPKFINGVTKFETSDLYTEAPLLSGSDYRWVYREKGYNNYWVLYRNVGIWKKHIVDMKISLDDVIDTDASKKCSLERLPDEDFTNVSFHSDKIGIGVTNQCRETGTMPIFKIEFFDDKSGEILDDIKTAVTYTDIDSLERILLDNKNIKEAYYYKTYGTEHLDLVDNNYKGRYTYFIGNNNWTCTYLGWPGDVQCIDKSNPGVNCANGDCLGCYKSGMIVTINDGSFNLGWGGQGLTFSVPSFFRINDPNSIKTVDKDKVKSGEELNYTIEQYVPNQSSNQYYQSWELKDELNEVLKANIDDITITTNDAEDIKDKFDITLVDNVLTIIAKKNYLESEEFYNRTFMIGIKTIVKDNIKGIKTIPNTAVLNVQYNSGSFSDDIPSSDVVVTIEGEEEPQEVVEVPNTSKFTSMMLIISGVVLVGSGIFIILKMTKKKLSS